MIFAPSEQFLGVDKAFDDILQFVHIFSTLKHTFRISLERGIAPGRSRTSEERAEVQTELYVSFS
jgi:hypothetical protein